ncbi:MAG: hypothetical protein H0T69_16565 [Thermoleophilaceae bacterium]|nr:hypothetical protein [Thermoleophilaceae bacterium]
MIVATKGGLRPVDGAVEGDVLPWCREHDVGVLVYGPMAHAGFDLNEEELAVVERLMEPATEVVGLAPD